MTSSIKFYSGTSGLALTIPKRLFPPQFENKTRLHYYASLFNSIEINSSFYKMPMSSTVHKWSEAVPEDFQFTFKLSKFITHNKGLEFKPDDITHFFKTIEAVGDKKGCLLVQFPPSLTIASVDVFKKLLKQIRKADPKQQWKTVVEFRNKLWYQQQVYDTLLRYNMGLVIHDHPTSTTPAYNPTTAFVYIRYHGPNGGYRGSYSPELLENRALQIREWLKDGKTVYVYFNNTLGEAVNNLIMLNDFVGEAKF